MSLPRPLSLAALALASLTLGTLACGGGGEQTVDARVIDAAPPIDAPMLPPFRNPVDLADLPLAQMAVARLGVGPRDACDTCHALTRERFQSWLTETRAADACIPATTPTTPAEGVAILECLRDATTGQWAPGKLGIYTTAAGLEYFYGVVQLAYGGSFASEWITWAARMPMPRGGQPLLSQAEFDIVAEWFARGLPELETVVPANPDPPGCTQMIGAEVGAHVAAMQTDGWAARNSDAGILMLGCAGATAPGECLSTFPLASTQSYATGWSAAAPTTTLRLLHTYPYASSYWTRSSADGRFVAHGGGAGSGATIIDLQDNRRIPAAANYDPGFFPDNTGFVIQGGAKAWCRQSLLTSNPAQVTFNEPQCSDVAVVGLYQHVGAAAGGDYWTVNGQFVSDNAGGEPPAWFDAGSTDYLTPMLWNGTAYSARAHIAVGAPFMGDTIISPSAKLLLSRVAGSGNSQNGFMLKKLVATPSGSTYTITTPEVGRYCVNGGKPAFSYDERWLVYHHWVQAGDWQAMGYASASDPEFTALLGASTANVFLLDITTGVSRRITSMAPGQEALFPHFRSDGWIYFIVKHATGGEVVVASDAALVFGT
ncbi:MAG: hypothetical protein IPL61_23250 [Myxococcales bacterium]|nr:hypothetical protein [Myxococcales bacterium]